MELVINVIVIFRFLLVLIKKKLVLDSNIKDILEIGLFRFGSCFVIMIGLLIVMVVFIVVFFS